MCIQIILIHDLNIVQKKDLKSQKNGSFYMYK